jgi:hypothetical protein
MEGVARDIQVGGIGEFRRDFRHVAGHALAAGASGKVVRMRLDRYRMWAILCVRAVARHTYFIDGLTQERIILSAVGVMA